MQWCGARTLFLHNNLVSNKVVAKTRRSRLVDLRFQRKHVASALSKGARTHHWKIPGFHQSLQAAASVGGNEQSDIAAVATWRWTHHATPARDCRCAFFTCSTRN
eukprot:3782314-Amphidinium_carterae.1